MSAFTWEASQCDECGAPGLMVLCPDWVASAKGRRHWLPSLCSSCLKLPEVRARALAKAEGR